MSAYRLTTLALLIVMGARFTSGCLKAAPALDYGDPTSLHVPTDEGGIVAYIDSPRPGLRPTAAQLEVALVAWAPNDVANDATRPLLEATLNGQLLSAADEPEGRQRFTGTTSLLHGQNLLKFVLVTEDGSRRRTILYPLRYDGPTPGIGELSVSLPDEQGQCVEGAPRLDVLVTASSSVCVSGQLSVAADAQLARATITAIEGSPTTLEVSAEGRFNQRVDLRMGTSQALSLELVDSLDRRQQASLTILQDSAPPQLSPISVPEDTDQAQLLFEVEATDDDRVARVWLELEASAQLELRYDVQSGRWRSPLRLITGPNAIKVFAQDRAGNQAQLERAISRTRVITMRAGDQERAAAQLSLDRAALEQLLPERAWTEIVALEIPLRPAIIRALYAIREPERYGVDTSEWGQAERNLFRLLNMSPDDADLRGSSIEELIEVANALGLPAPRILGQLLDAPVEQPFVSLEIVADVVLEQLIGTHPQISRDAQGQPTLKLTMDDLRKDLSTLAGRFGPSQGHPGFLRGSSFAQVFEPGFRMTLNAESNLERFDGLDASRQRKDYISIARSDQALTFDFLDPQTFNIVGLSDEPVVDLEIAIEESSSFLRAGSARQGNPDAARQGFYRGDGQVWSQPEWELGPIVAEAAYRQYHDKYSAQQYERALSYDAGAVTAAATLTWSRGWVTMQTAAGVGNPPMPLYLWDLLLEVAQLRLHDGGLAYGEADVAFKLKGLPVGLDADALIERLRPSLQAQGARLSELLVGQQGLASSGCDLYLVEGQGGLALYFRGPQETPTPYPYATAGMYSDAALTQKLSSLSLPGHDDLTHEKLKPVAGQTLYYEDDERRRWRVEIKRVEGKEIAVTAREVTP